MDRQELKNFFLSHFLYNKLISCYQTIKNKYHNIKDCLIDETNYLPENVTFNERLYNIINDIYEIKTCKICSKKVRFVNFNIGYNKYCSKSCSYKDNEVINKRKNTNIRKYGHIAPIGNKEIRDKIENTNLIRYGTKNVSKSEIIKEKKKNKSIERYGTDHVFQAEEVKNKIVKTNLEKYGVENPMNNKDIQEKTKETNLEKYGFISPLQNSDIRIKSKKTLMNNYGVESPLQSKEILERSIKTSINNYGVNHPTKSDVVKNSISETFIKKYGTTKLMEIPEIYNKYKRTCEEKYGVNHPMKSDIIKDKIKSTCINNYGVDHPMKSEEIKNKVLNSNNNNFLDEQKEILKSLKLSILNDDYNNAVEYCIFKCLQCGHEFKANWNQIQQGRLCPQCFPNNLSYSQKELFDFLNNYSLDLGEIVLNERNIIKPKHLDIYILSKNVAIEYDGLYFHSEKFKDKKYHINKTDICYKNNIRLIHIFEDEWILKKDIVKNRLKRILNLKPEVNRIHARKCIIKEIDPKTKNEFLEKYHLQGRDSSTIKLGAFYNNELVSVMTFSKGNISKGSKNVEGIWELNRFCSNFNFIIPGIASKLLVYFKRNYEWKKIFSYADRRWSNGNLYYKLGFDLEYITQPNYWYIKGMKRIHRYSLRKRSDEPKDISERILRENDGYERIWDCGNYKFIMKRD